MTLKQIEWFATIISILGTILNAFMRIEGFYFWIIGNIAWIYIGHQRKMRGVMFMFGVYTLLAILGIYNWWR